MMKASFLRVAIGTCAAISLGASAANAQSAKPKSPGEVQRRASALPSEMKIAGVRRESSICIS